MKAVATLMAVVALAACTPSELPEEAASPRTPAIPRKYPTPAGAAVPSVRPVAARGPAFVGVPEEGVLPNGVRVRVYPDASLPMVSVAFVATHPPTATDTLPLRWMFARSMLGATGSNTREESFAALGYVATFVDHHVSDGSVAWYFDTLEPLWITAFRRVAAMLSDPRFEAKDVARDLVRCEDDITREAAESELTRLLYGAGHPFAAPSDATCKGLTREAIVAYRDRAFAPENLAVVVAGDVTFAQVMFEAKDDFQGLVNHGLAPAVAVPAVGTTATPRTAVVSRVENDQQVKVLFGFPAVGIASPDLAALRVLGEALGGPLTGRLNSKVRRERGSTYGVSAGPHSATTTGTFVIRASIAVEDAGPSIAAIFEELERVKTERLGPAELVAAKRSALMAISTHYEGPRAAMRDVMALEKHGLPHWGKLAQAIDVVTADDVRHVAEKYLRHEHMQSVLEGDPKKLQAVTATLRE